MLFQVFGRSGFQNKQRNASEILAKTYEAKQLQRAQLSFEGVFVSGNQQISCLNSCGGKALSDYVSSFWSFIFTVQRGNTVDNLTLP